jgi:hypothetical protein
LTKEEIDEGLRTARIKDKFVFYPDEEIQPGGEGHFSFPNQMGIDQEHFDKFVDSLKTKNAIVYLFVVSKYKDPLMASGKIRESDYCVSYQKDFVNAHFCRQNGVHLEDY